MFFCQKFYFCLYRRIILSVAFTGWRCVELDCWDGDDDQPVIYHRHEENYGYFILFSCCGANLWIGFRHVSISGYPFGADWGENSLIGRSLESCCGNRFRNEEFRNPTKSIYSEEVNALTFFPISHLESLSSTAFPETGNESTEIGQWMKSITTKFS